MRLCDVITLETSFLDFKFRDKPKALAVITAGVAAARGF
jgi:hypothetical protein